VNQRSVWIVLACILAASGCQGATKTAATHAPGTAHPSPASSSRARTRPPAPARERNRAVAAASPTPSPAPTDAPPQILAVHINSTNVQSGDTIVGSVFATPNVASVEVRVATYGMTMKKVGVGRFVMSYTVGNIPFFLHGTYDMRVIARNTRGDAVTRTLPLTIH
jgi:hypothetical protein